MMRRCGAVWVSTRQACIELYALGPTLNLMYSDLDFDRVQLERQDVMRVLLGA